MGQPIEPTPGAPAPAPNPPAAAPPTGPPAPPAPADPAPAAAFDPSSLTPEAKAYLKAQVDAADLKARTTSKANAADEARKALTAQLAKALGIQTGDEPPDPEALTQQVQEARDAAWRSGVELQVYRAAGRLGGNAEAMLDSLKFIDSLDDLIDVDPASPDFATQLEAKVTAAIEGNASFKAAGQAPAGQQSTAPGAPRPDPSQGARGQAPQRFDGSLTAAVRAHYAGQPQK